MVAMSNEYAPEHLIIMCKDYATVSLGSMGAVFLFFCFTLFIHLFGYAGS